MPYLIDTDWMIDRLDDVPEAAALLDTLSSEGIAVSIITYLELYQGVLRSEDRHASERHLDGLLDAIPSSHSPDQWPVVARPCDTHSSRPGSASTAARST